MVQGTNNQLMIGLNNAMIPKEGPRTIPILCRLSLAASVLVDMSLNNALAQIAFVQSLYIDNSPNSSPVTITVPVTGQNITIPAYQQAYVPILVPNPVKFFVASAGGVDITIQCLNVPLPAAVLNADPLSYLNFDNNGYLLVSAPIIEALISDLGGGNALNVNVVSGGGGGSGLSGLPLTSYAYTGGFLTLLSATGAGARYRLTGIDIRADPTIFDATSGDAEVEWVVQQSTTRNLFTGRIWLPKIAPSLPALGTPGAPASLVPLLYATGFEDIGTVNNEVLRFNLPNSFSGGSIRITVWGEANYVP